MWIKTKSGLKNTDKMEEIIKYEISDGLTCIGFEYTSYVDNSAIFFETEEIRNSVFDTIAFCIERGDNILDISRDEL